MAARAAIRAIGAAFFGAEPWGWGWGWKHASARAWVGSEGGFMLRVVVVVVHTLVLELKLHAAMHYDCSHRFAAFTSA